MTTDISKAGFYRNWYEIAKDFETAEERLAFYDMIFEYFFEGKEPEKQTIGSGLYRLFMSVKANIEADIERRNGGAPEGNNNARKGKSCRKCVYRKSCSNASRATNAELCPDFEYSSEGNNPKSIPKQPKTIPKQPKTNNVNVNVNVNDNVNENVNDNVNEKGNVNGDSQIPIPPPSPTFSAPAMSEYSSQVFDIFKEAGLPCANGNPISFMMTDFKNAMSYKQKSPELQGLHSDDLLGACRNYAELYSSEGTFEGYRQRLSFYELIQKKWFYGLLPANFDSSKYAKKEAAEVRFEEKRWYEICPDCGKKKLFWSNDKQLYICEACGANKTYEEAEQWKQSKAQEM